MNYNPMKDIYQSKEVLNELRKFALLQKHSGFLFLQGKNGTGKTYIAKSIYWHKTGFNYPRVDQKFAYFWECCELKQVFFENMSKNGNENLRDYCKNTELLIIDDIGANNMDLKGPFSEFLFSIINYRYENKDKLGTIITTNMNGKDFSEAIGHAFLSRVASGILLKFEGPDRRFNEDYKLEYGD